MKSRSQACKWHKDSILVLVGVMGDQASKGLLESRYDPEEAETANMDKEEPSMKRAPPACVQTKG